MTLDPQDWESVRATGRRMVEDMVTWQETARDQAHWRPVPDEAKARLDEPVPYAGMSLDEVYDAFLRDVLPYPTGNGHPRFWGWVMGTGSATGMLAEMLAAGMNSHLAGYDQSATLIEKKVIAWLDMVKQDASEIYLVGDIFDFWFEYKYTVPKGFVRLLGKLAEITDNGTKVHVFTGNHDMWMFDYLPKEIGVELHREPIEKIYN